MSRHADVAKAIDYMLKRRKAFTRFLDDGRICLTNNAAERALRGIALGRKSWLFAGSDRGGSSVLDPFEFTLHDAGLGWIAFIISRIDRQHSCLNALQILRGIVVARRLPPLKCIVRVGRERGRRR
jgi:hypothetical protein